jgi:hypothetical protein
MFADVLALPASSNEIEYPTAHGMLSNLAGITDLRECAHIARASAADHLAPVRVIGFGELWEQPHQCAVCRILNLVGQFNAICLVSTTEKDLGAADDMTEQALNALAGDFQMSLCGLAGLDGFRTNGGPMGVQSFLSRDVRGDGLPQILRGGAVARSRKAMGCSLQRRGFHSR